MTLPDSDSTSDATWPEAKSGMMKVAAATIFFALWHSFLSSDSAKNGARRLLGERRGTALYRAGFMAQALPLTIGLFYYIWKQPNRVLYQARGALKILAWTAQVACLAVAAASYLTFDKPKFLGLKGIAELAAKAPLDEAQAQGPELEPDGQVRASGVFRYSRHPLEWVLALVFLVTPKMKTNWLVFALLNTLYSFLGALHEEKRLGRQTKHYAAYQKQVAFLLGKPKS